MKGNGSETVRFLTTVNTLVCMYVCICKSSQLVDIFSFQGLKKHHNSIFSKKSLKAGAGYEIPLSKSSFVDGLVCPPQCTVAESSICLSKYLHR